MKNKARFIIKVGLLLVASFTAIFAQQKFYINLNNRADDLFKVTLIPEKLTEQNNIYQFASTAPGTYEIEDVGRYVRSFKAFDNKGNELASKQISTNQWELKDPVNTSKIVYTIAETWDTPMKENAVVPICGTSIEKDYVLINGQCVFGYFHGMQHTPIKIKLDYPHQWLAGTALNLDENGFYDAPDFDNVVDSPILLGNLTKATTKIENTTIDVFTYSKTGMINSSQMLSFFQDILYAENKFTQGLPVKRYTFLFHFGDIDISGGAWEHNYSSEYIFKEEPLKGRAAEVLRMIIAHEFYHIIVPLHIHSELVGNFNFERPTMSQHLWLYEGVTEWAAGILQLRDSLMTLDEYLGLLQLKLILSDDNYDQNISLVDLSVNAYEMLDQYANIYQRGAVTDCLLDIRLLELSNGTKGLREVMNQLYKDYGVNKSFSEKNFFDEFVHRTYPEIGDFINKYIKGTEKLPIKEYFAKLGIDYKEIAGVDSSKSSLGFGVGLKDNRIIVTLVDNPVPDGVRTGDFINKVNGEEVTLQNMRSKYVFMIQQKAGTTINLTVERDGVEKEVKFIVQPRPIKHQFKVLDNPSKEQLFLRNIWMKNL
jgi:predicted metalloprotease with PDZ domain